MRQPLSPLTRRLLIGALLVAGAAVVAVFVYRGSPGSPDEAAEVTEAERAPADVRVRVEVLNATRIPRLARRATRALRDRGFDVVAIGTHPEQLDSTLVLDRTGHPDWAARAAAAMQGARVELRPDSSRYLDITVLIGRSWRPPPETFYP